MLFSDMKKRSSKVVFASALLCVTGVTLAQSQQLHKGVVIDVESQQVYVSNPQGGLDSIDVNSGNHQWHNADADLPLTLQSNHLIAQSDTENAGAFELLELNTSNGAMSQSRSVTVPTSVKARVADDLNERFGVSVVSDGLSRQSIQWSYEKNVAKGMPDLTPQNPIVSFGEIVFENNSALQDASARDLSERPVSNPISIEGRFLDGVNGRQFTSIGKEHVLVSQRKDDQPFWQKYEWDIHNSVGRHLGQIKHANAYVPFEVINDVLLFVTLPSIRYEGQTKIESPLLLQAFSLASGQQLWSREVRDLSYKGPYPQ